MKLIIAIVHNEDAHKVSSELVRAGHFTTKLATTGGLLLSGNTTFLSGVADDKVDEVIDIIGLNAQKRKEFVPPSAPYSLGIAPTLPVEVTVGGATIFVLDVGRFEKIKGRRV